MKREFSSGGVWHKHYFSSQATELFSQSEPVVNNSQSEGTQLFSSQPHQHTILARVLLPLMLLRKTKPVCSYVIRVSLLYSFILLVKKKEFLFVRSAQNLHAESVIP